jgi:D-glycero-D-manno-heptose 1,7-bisphosphate phosphatase
MLRLDGQRPVPRYCYHSRVKIELKGAPQESVQNGTKSMEFHPKLRNVFLDRDGVINRKMPEGEYVTGWGHFHLLQGVPEAIARLNQAGLRVLVVTNQRGVALGLYSAADVDAIHAQLQAALAKSGAHVDGIYYCPHDKRACSCRKPLPGLFEQAQKDFPEITAAESVVVGDSLSDIEFGRNLGMQTIFIEGDPERRKAGAELASNLADLTVSSLPEAVDQLLQPGTTS